MFALAMYKLHKNVGGADDKNDYIRVNEMCSSIKWKPITLSINSKKGSEYELNSVITPLAINAYPMNSLFVES